MEKSFKQAVKGFLAKTIEIFSRISRKNVFAYYWVRRILPLYIYFTGVPHESSFKILKIMPNRPGVLLDVGANDGVSVFSIRTLNKTNPILSIEPNPEHEGRLRMLGRFFKNHNFKIAAAGDKSGELTLYSPVYKGYPITSFATLNPELLDFSSCGMFAKNYDPNQLSFVKHTVDIILIDELNLDVSFVKIDAEGADLSVLKGMLSTIKRCKPVIMIEACFAISEVRELIPESSYKLVNPVTGEFINYDEVVNEVNFVFWPVGLIPKN